MLSRYLNWKGIITLVALLIVSATLLYTNSLAKKLAEEEKMKVEIWAEGIKSLASSNADDISFYNLVISSNSTIPVIMVDEEGNIIENSYKNLDSTKVATDTTYLKKKLVEFKQAHPPIIVQFKDQFKNYVYYGESYLLLQLRYFPYIQLSIIGLFLVLIFIMLSIASRSLQNQVWVGMSKETAHQLGTPLTSLEAWLEHLKENRESKEMAFEMQKDLDRLKLIADRFSKIGSVPNLEPTNVTERLENMVEYMRKRAPQRVRITLHDNGYSRAMASMSGPLFDWVIENLLRNALDAMEGKGNIDLYLNEQNDQVVIDVTDDGKGIPGRYKDKIFTPGFSTKKRGWGLGLSLAKRIVNEYHKGNIFLKHSEPGKGTTFRITLKSAH
jgi:signal transduction histidine kinase